MTQQLAQTALRITNYVVKIANFSAGATVFSDEAQIAAWIQIPIGRVLESRATLENGVFGNRINPVNSPEKSFFIPDEYFTGGYFRATNSNRNPKFIQPAIRR